MEPMSRVLVMLDLDGTLIGTEDDEAAEVGLSLLAEAGFTLAVCTNQPDRLPIGAIDTMVHETRRGSGGVEIEWYICRHARDAGCACRKPMPGLLLEAMGDGPFTDYWMIGDKWSDVLAAKRAGANAVLVGDFGYKQKGSTPMEPTLPPDFWAPNLFDAARLLTGLYATGGAQDVVETVEADPRRG